MLKLFVLFLNFIEIKNPDSKRLNFIIQNRLLNEGLYILISASQRLFKLSIALVK